MVNVERDDQSPVTAPIPLRVLARHWYSYCVSGVKPVTGSLKVSPSAKLPFQSVSVQVEVPTLRYLNWLWGRPKPHCVSLPFNVADCASIFVAPVVTATGFGKSCPNTVDVIRRDNAIVITTDLIFAPFENAGVSRSS